MINLNEIDLSHELATLADVNEMEVALCKKKHDLEALVKHKALEYYGTGGKDAYLKENSRTFNTDDGYTVEIDNWRISISIKTDTGSFSGYGTVYDKPFSDLSFNIAFQNGRSGNGYAKKYDSIRTRMQEIQKEVSIYNPFKDFEKIMIYA